MVPHEHPLWGDFQAWVRVNIPKQEATMLTIYWECFLAGAQAAARAEATARRRPPPKDIGMVATEGPDQPKFDRMGLSGNYADGEGD